MDGDKKVIYVYGTKGGVGKSTISVNLAYALQKQGKTVSLVDLDMAGPNISTMINEDHKSKNLAMDEFQFVPEQNNGVNIISLGRLIDPDDFCFFTGKYLEGALNQIILDNNKIDTEFVIIDMPPGFGEIHRLMFSKCPGKVLLVTTPQKLSYENLRRGVFLINKMGIEILGIVENMSYFICSICGRANELFRNKQSSKINLPILTKIPFKKSIDFSSNIGVVRDPKENLEFINLASKILDLY